MKKDNQILRKEVTSLLDQKEDLRNHLQEKLKDAEKFRDEIEKLEQEYTKRVEDRNSVFRDYLSMTKIKLVKKIKSLLGVIQTLKDEVLLLKEKASKDKTNTYENLEHTMNEIKDEIIKKLKNSNKINLMKEPSNKSLSQQFGNNSKVLTPFSTQRSIDKPEKKTVNEADYQSLNNLPHDKKIDHLHVLLFEQKEANRKFLEINYRSEDLSVTTEQQHVEDPDDLEREVQDLRRLRDRLKHENFGLQSDVEELEEEKEKCLAEIEEHESHLLELKGN